MPFDISILTIQLIVRRLAILHFHATMALAPKGNPKSPSPSVLPLTMTHYPSSSQNRSPILTAISPFFRTQSPCTLDPIQSTSIVYTISPMLDGSAINYQKRRKTLTSPFCTALWRSSFRPFPAMYFFSRISSVFSFTSHTPF